MDRIMRKQQLCQLAAELHSGFEETGEAIVADTLPDLSDIVDVHAQVMIRDKSVQEGSVLLSGTILMSALCIPEGGGSVHSMEIPITFSQKLRMEGAQSGMLAQCRAGVSEAEGKLLNPRKLGVRTVVQLHISLYRETESSVVSEIRGDDTVQTLQETLDARELRTACSKNFTVIEDTDISQADISNILQTRVSIENEEAAVSAGRISCRAAAKLTILYLDSRESLRVFQADLPFNQMLEQPGMEEEMRCSCSFSLRSIELTPGEDGENGENTLTVTLGICADFLVSSREQYSIVRDAYGTVAELVWAAQPYRYQPWTEEHPCSMEVQESFPSVGGISRILLTELSQTDAEQQEDGRWEVTLRANVLATQEDGSLVHRVHSFKVGIPQEMNGRPYFIVRQCSAVPEGESIRLTARIVQADLQPEWKTVETVGEISEGELYPRREDPELVLCFDVAEQGLWSIAKRCHITQEAIRAANGLDNGLGEMPGKPGRVLLIPLMN